MPDLEEEEKPYDNYKSLDFFKLVKAVKKKALFEVTNNKLRVVKDKLRKVDTITSMITISVLVMYTVEFENYNANGLKSTFFNHSLRAIMIISNGFACYVLNYHYKYLLETYKILKLKHPSETLRSSGLFRGFLIECIISMVICPPFLDFSFNLPQMQGMITISIESICYTVCLFKSYTLLRLPEQYIKWTDDVSSSICKKNKCKADVGFLIKCEFNRRPYIVVITSFLIVTILLGFLVRAYESTYYRETPNGIIINDYFKLFFNCFWFMVVTMMTVGYGDGYPLSHLGRIIAFIGCVLGTMIVSLMVVSLQNTSALTIAEQRVYTEVDRTE